MLEGGTSSSRWNSITQHGHVGSNPSQHMSVLASRIIPTTNVWSRSQSSYSEKKRKDKNHMSSSSIKMISLRADTGPKEVLVYGQSIWERRWHDWTFYYSRCSGTKSMASLLPNTQALPLDRPKPTGHREITHGLLDRTSDVAGHMLHGWVSFLRGWFEGEAWTHGNNSGQSFVVRRRSFLIAQADHRIIYHHAMQSLHCLLDE